MFLVVSFPNLTPGLISTQDKDLADN